MKKHRELDSLYWLSKKLMRIMKLTCILILALMMSVSAATYSQSTDLSLNVKNKTLVDVLKLIEDQSDFYFYYNNADIVNLKDVSVDVKGKKIDRVMGELLDGTGLEYKMIDRYIVIKKTGSSSSEEFTIQQKEVTGSVNDSSGQPLPGVSIVIKGTTTGTITDFDGNFNLRNVSEDATLVFSFVGMKTTEVSVSGQDVFNLVLEDDAIGIDEVIAVGYGTQKKVNLTGAVENVSMNDLANRPITNTSAALQGKIAGVYVTQNSGQPGKDDAKIQIRGVGTLNNNNPLVLVDGVPGSMNDVNPRDIESMTVLKDAAASAIYGNRAANGVILITTKRGERGKMNVEYSMYYARQEATYLPEILNAGEHAELYNEALANSGNSPKYTDEEIAKYKSGNDPNYPNTNWQQVMFNPADMKEHHLRASGSSDNLAYSFSGGYLDHDGVLLGTGFKRYTFRTNIDSYYLENKLHIGVNMSGLRSNRVQSAESTTAVIRAINRGNPTEVLQYENGLYGAGFMGKTYAWIKSGAEQNDLTNSFTGKVFADYKIYKGLSAEISYGVKYYHNLYTKHVTALDLYNHKNDGHTIYKSSIREDNREDFSTIYNALLKYDVSVSDSHNFNVLAGYSEETWRTDWSRGDRKDLLSGQAELSIGDVSTQTNDGGANATALRSYFGRVNYNFDGKYLLEANVRYDGSSRFAEDLRHGTFPSFSAGWRLSEEAFMDNASFVENLKIRASWGQLGNQNINTYYAASDILATGANYTMNGALLPGVAVTTLTNKSTSWETSTQTNIGVDATLFRKFNVTANYFQKKTEDMLMQVPIPITLGNLKKPYQNIAEMEDKGWELTMSYFDNIGKDFSFDASVNLSHYKNEITDLQGLGPIYDSKYILTEGEAYRSFYGYEVEGIFQSESEISGAPSQSENPKPGDIKFKDQDGDGEITLADDRVVIGSANPDIIYAVQLNAQYKGFDMRAFFQGVQGVDAYSSLELTSPFFNGASSGKWLLDRWTPENPSTTNQRVFIDTKRPGIVSEYYLEDASYLRLKNIELGYSLSNSLVNKIGISGLRVYVNVQNAFTITNFKGFDPEKPGNNTRSDAHPQVRITSLGFNLKF